MERKKKIVASIAILFVKSVLRGLIFAGLERVPGRNVPGFLNIFCVILRKLSKRFTDSLGVEIFIVPSICFTSLKMGRVQWPAPKYFLQINHCIP